MRAREKLGTLLQRPRILKYRALSTCTRVHGSPTVLQPLLCVGEGAIFFGSGVEFGWRRSQAFYSGYCHVEALTEAAVIEIGDGAHINNNAFIKSEGAGIRIGPRALLGSEVTIYDSDFHDLRPHRRPGGRPQTAPVELAEDVFIGDRVLILKGVTIGVGSVIGAGSVVSSSIPAGVIAAGAPARVIKPVPGDGSQEVNTVRVY